MENPINQPAVHSEHAEQRSEAETPDTTLLTSGARPLPPTREARVSLVAASKKASIWDALHIPQDVQESAKGIGQLIGAVSTASSWIGTVQTALKFMGFIKPEPNPFDILFDRIQREFRIVMATTLAGSTEERLRDVAEQVAIARTAAQNANEYILLGRPNTPFHLSRMALADRDSSQVLNLLAAPDWWKRSFDPSPAAINGPQIPGPPSLAAGDWWHPPEGRFPGGGAFDPIAPSGGLVWDYRHILPAYLQAVAARVVVLRARAVTSAEFLGFVAKEIPGYISFLSDLHKLINDNIRVTTPPPPHQGVFPPFMFRTGAVELFTGTHVFGAWHPILADPVPPPFTYDEHIRLYEPFVEDCRRRVYNAVGLNQLQFVIDNLKRLSIPEFSVVTGSGVSASAAITGSVAAEQQAHVFVVGGDGGLHVLSRSGSEAAWQWRSAGRPPATQLNKFFHHPVAIGYGEDAGRRIHSFMRTDAGRLYTYFWDGATWNWVDLVKAQGAISWDPSVTTFQLHGRQQVRAYVVGDGKLWANWWSGSGRNWIDLGKPPHLGQDSKFGLHGTPTVVTYRFDGKLLDDLYIVSQGGLYEHVWYEDGRRVWSKPRQPANVSLLGDPAAVMYEQDGKPIVHVFVVDTNGRLHGLEWNSGWHWVEHGAPPATGITASPIAHPIRATVMRWANVPNRPIAVVIGNNGRLYTRMGGSGGWIWQDLRTPPGTTARDVLGLNAYVKNGTFLGLDIFVRGENLHIYRTGISFDNTWDDLGIR